MDTCPRTKAREDLLEFISDKNREGNRIILMIDGNENMRTGKLGNILKKEFLNMRDAICDRVGNRRFTKLFCDQEKIDAIWTSEEIEVDSMTYLPFFFGIGDHW